MSDIICSLASLEMGRGACMNIIDDNRTTQVGTDKRVKETEKQLELLRSCVAKH